MYYNLKIFTLLCTFRFEEPVVTKWNNLWSRCRIKWQSAFLFCGSWNELVILEVWTCFLVCKPCQMLTQFRMSKSSEKCFYNWNNSAIVTELYSRCVHYNHVLLVFLCLLSCPYRMLKGESILLCFHLENTVIKTVKYSFKNEAYLTFPSTLYLLNMHLYMTCHLGLLVLMFCKEI